MNRNFRFLILPTLLMMGVGCATQSERVSADKNPPAATDADNTARNMRDRDGATQTPVDQSESEADRNISASIRKAVVEDSSLSANAHNVKIITSGGVVTLRGPVKSSQEKASIEAKAKQLPGVTRVDNFLEIESSR